MWQSDKMFSKDIENADSVGSEASPAFRFFAQLPYERAHPYKKTNEYENLFACFAPILKERCNKIIMWDNPGAKARRSKKINPDDWHPFEQLKKTYSDIEQGIFTGFNFVDGSDKDMEGRGPCSFRFFVDEAIRLDACIPLDDWQTGQLDIGRVISAIMELPYYSFSAGFGLSLSDQYLNGARSTLLEELMPVASRYPAVDIMHASNRNRAPEKENDIEDYWISGINWITGVGEPFLSAIGGINKITSKLSETISVATNKNGATFRIGDRPISGLRNHDDEYIRLYHQLGNALKPPGYPSHNHPPFPVFGDFKRTESLAWMRRFYDA